MSGGNFHVGPPGPLGGTIRRLCFSSLLCGPQRGRRTQRNNAGTAARAMPAYWTETVQKGKSDLNADGKRRNIIRTLVPKFGNFESDIRQHTCSMSRGAKSRQKTGNQPNSRLNPGVIPAPRADHFGNGIKTGAALAVFLQAAVVTHKFFFSRQHQPIPTLPSLLNSNAFHYSMPGEDRWFQPTVRNRLSQAVVLANLTIKLGKFYDIKNPYDETASAQGTIIQGKSENEWGHCGRHSSPTGTEGSFEVHLEDGGEKIAEVYWDCPYIGNNQLVKRYVKPGYDVSFDGFSIPKGALGKGSINVRED